MTMFMTTSMTKSMTTSMIKSMTTYLKSLLFLTFALVALHAPVSLGQGSCSHLGETVQCPDGVAPGTTSLRFEGMYIIWGDGSMTPVSECCSPFEPMIPTPPEPTPPEPTPPEPTPPEPTPPEPTPPEPTPPEPTPPEPTPPEPTPPEPTPPEPTPPEPTPPEPTPPVTGPSIGLQDNLKLKGPTDEFVGAPQPASPSTTTGGVASDPAGLNPRTFSTLEEEVEREIALEKKRQQDAFAAGVESGVSYCGPDVTQGFLEALELIAVRIQALPDRNKGTLDGLQFMLDNGQDMDYLPRLDFWQGNNPNCPNNRCASSDPCFTLFDTCVPRHVLSDTMYGFAVGMIGLHRQEAVAGGAYAEFNKQSGNGWLAAAKSALEDIGGPASDMKENPASVGAYYFGHSVAQAVLDGKLGGEDNTPVSGMTPDDVTEEGDSRSTFDRYIKPTMRSAYAWMEQCKTCPDTTPLYTYGWVNGIFSKRKDWSRMAWDIVDADGNDAVQEINDEFLFQDPFEDAPRVLSAEQTGPNTYVEVVEDKLDSLELVIKKHATYLRPWEKIYNERDIDFQLEDDESASAATAGAQ